jgi:hypothetical protein
MLDTALSIRQPWTGLIVLGFKPIENRTWPIPVKYLGDRVYVHAGQSVDLNALAYRGQPIQEAAAQLAMQAGVSGAEFLKRLEQAPQVFSLGGIVGAVDLIGCGRNVSRSPWAVQRPEIWHWRLAAPEALPFTPCKGQLQFFTPDSVPSFATAPHGMQQAALI